MKYLFVSGSSKDMGGFAMMLGAMNGIKRLDPNAQFVSLLDVEHTKQQQGISWCCYYPLDREEAFEWADRILDVGGLCFPSVERLTLVHMAEDCKVPYIWMSQSFAPVMAQNAHFLKGTYVIARGPHAQKIVKEATGVIPYIGADLSFLVKESGNPRTSNFIFVTHRNALGAVERMAKIANSIPGTKLQQFWNSSEPSLEKRVGQINCTEVGDVGEAFNQISKARAAYTSRYQAACAAIKYQIPVKIMAGRNTYKYEDLLYFRGWSIAKLEQSAMVSCKIAVEPWEVERC